MKRIASASAAAGALVGSVMLWIGIRHDPQGEFVDTATGAVDVRHCALLFGTWAVATFAALFLAAGAARRVIDRMRSR